jgi:histone acetyltransferase MYST1
MREHTRSTLQAVNISTLLAFVYTQLIIVTKHSGIYKKGINKIYQINGKHDKLFCQNLSLLSKLFLDHKTVFYDISPFLFYVMTELEQDGKECVVGYFSKEKKSYEGHNLACILVLPPFQKKGYGRLLIEFSYELSKLENTLGSPEKPLSDLGLLGYRSFWKAVILDILKQNGGVGITIKDLCTMTSIKQEDVVSTLTFMGMLRYWKGENIISYTFILSDSLIVRTSMHMIEKYIEDHGIVTSRRVDPICINWVAPDLG